MQTPTQVQIRCPDRESYYKNKEETDQSQTSTTPTTMSSANLQVIVQPSIEAIKIIDTPIPTPRPNEIVIKVAVAASNPKDWKYPLWKNLPHNSGDDLSGTVHSVGKEVFEFKPGDRVAAFHLPGTKNGAYGQYTVARDTLTFHLPSHVSFEEGATVPTAVYTALVGLFFDLGIRPPYVPADQGERKKPLLIYGITTAVGACAAKLARLSNVGPIIGVAGRGQDFASTLADYVVDYRKGEDALVQSVQEILQKGNLGDKFDLVYDAIGENGSLAAIKKIINPEEGVVSTVLPPALFSNDVEFPTGVKLINCIAPRVYTSHVELGYLWSRYTGRLLSQGKLSAHPYEVIPGGLDGVLEGLKKLKDGKASGLKYVYRVAQETLTKEAPKGEAPTKPESPSTHPMSVFPFPVAIED